MSNELPTKPDLYWFTDGKGNQSMVHVYQLANGVLYGMPLVANRERMPLPTSLHDWIQDFGQGKWQRVDRPDQGVPAWAVFVDGEIRCHSIGSRIQDVEAQLGFYQKNNFSKKCTIEPVTIYRGDNSL